MGWTNFTFVGITEDGGGDLVLNDGVLVGTATSPKSDGNAQDSLGSCFRHITAVWAIAENPADSSEPKYLIELRTSVDDATWTAYSPYGEGDYLCRYLQWRITLTGDTLYGQRPKITRFEANAPAADSQPWQGEVQSTANSPPAGGLLGSRYLVGTGAGAWAGKDKQIAVCQSAQDATYRFIQPRVGMFFYHRGDAIVMGFDEYSEWVSADARKTGPFRQHCEAQSYDAVSGAPGLWAYTIDANQANNGYMETATGGLAADADYIDFKIGLLCGTYDLFLIGCTGPNCGKQEIRLEEASVPVIALFDQYSAGFTNNVRRTQTAIAVIVAKPYTLRVKINGKNPVSGGFESYLTWICIAPA